MQKQLSEYSQRLTEQSELDLVYQQSSREYRIHSRQETKNIGGKSMKRCYGVALASVLTLGAPSLMAQSTTACALNPANRTVTICTPQNRTSPIQSPVRVVAGCTDSRVVSIIQIYINGQKVKQFSSNQVDQTIPMANGNNNIAVLCQERSGVFFSTNINTAVSGGCTFGGGPGSLVICLPEVSTVSSPVHFVARDQDPGNLIHGMRVVDSSNQTVLYQGCGRNLDTWIKLAPGTYNFTVESLYGCADPPPGSAEGGQLGPVTVN